MTRSKQGGPASFSPGDLQAVIDIGTNSVRLLVGKVSRGRVAVSQQAMFLPRLGQGVHKTRRLAAAAMKRSLQAIQTLQTQAARAGARDLVLLGTSALREAKNRDTFLHKVFQETGLKVQVLTGAQEAALSFYGAVRSVPRVREGTRISSSSVSKEDLGVYVVDVGGGSTELAHGSPEGILSTRASVDVGAVRMTELCLSVDPPTETDWQGLLKRVVQDLTPLWKVAESQGSGDAGFKAPVIAVGGTATTLAALALALPRYDGQQVHGSTLKTKEVTALVQRLRRKPLAARRALGAMQPERADVMPAGALILEQVLIALETDTVMVSDADLLVGALLARWEQGEPFS